MLKLALTFILLFSWPAKAYFQKDFMEAKRAQKEASQWTLTDWLTQKRRIALWDQWLAMNRQATVYEVNARGGHSRYELTATNGAGVESKSDEDAQAYNLEIYYKIFGIFGEYEKTTSDRESFGGGLGLKLFGTSSQTTNLSVRYGWRKRMELQTREYWENQFGEGELQFYLAKFFGLSGRYRAYLPNESNQDRELSGSRATGGIFVEGMIFRLFAEYYQEPLEFKDSNGVITKERREGYEAGLKLYF